MTTAIADPPVVSRRSPRRPLSVVPDPPPALPRALRVNADVVHGGPHVLRLHGPEGHDAELSGSGMIVMRRLLLLMDGRRSTDWLLACVPAADRPAVGMVMRRLLDAGFLQASRPAAGPLRRISVLGSGRLAGHLASRLCRIACIECYQDALPGVPPDFTPPDRPIRHWTETAERPCDLVVWAPGGRAPDPAVAWALVRAGTPHLVVTADGSRGQVSPLVIPGITACAECQGGAANWPKQSRARFELVAEPADPGRDTMQWASQMAQAFALAHLRSGLATRGADIEGRNLHPSRPDPDCGICSSLVSSAQSVPAA